MVASNSADVLGLVNANYSLIGYTSGASITGSNNQLNVNAMLGAFNYYGGTTKVFPLLPGSPAIDSGTGSGVTDQRGVTVAGTADMGSFQSRGFAISNTGGTGQVAMIGDAFPTNLSLNVASAYSEPVQGGVISFTFTGGANSTAFTPTSAVITGGANASAGGISIQAVANANYSNQTYTALGNATGANAAASYTLKNVGTPARLSITGGNLQSGPLAGNFGQSLAINVKDSVENNIPRQVVSFTPSTTTVGNTYGALLNVGGAGNGSVYTSQTDDSGNLAVSFGGNGVGGKFQVQANATVSAIGGVRSLTTQLNNFTESSVGLNVQGGTAGRSFVNNVAAVLGNTSLSQNLVTSGNVRIKFLGYTGSDYLNPAGSATPNSGGTSNITFNYGQTGIGGDNNSQTGDGVYQLEVDYTGNQFANATLVTTAKFHRLFGDVNGDKVVDTLDYNVVINPTVYGKFGVTSGANTNGVGQVYTKDVTTVLRQRGRRVSYNVY